MQDITRIELNILFYTVHFMDCVLIAKCIIMYVCMMKYTMDEWRNKGGGSGLFTFNVVSEALNKSFFEIQLHHHMYSKDGSPGMFHRSTRYLLLKYVYLLCVFAFIWSLLMWKGQWNRMRRNWMHRMTVRGFSEMEGASPCLLRHGFPICLKTVSKAHKH